MTVSEQEPLPDIALGHHPEFGIVAANPKRSAAATWMLKGLGFRPVPGHPVLYALADQQRDGHGRATRAVAFLRQSGYQVDVDAALDPAPSSGTAAPASGGPPRVDPDVVFTEHPQLGVVAATTEGSSLGGRMLEKHGWQHDLGLDIYTLPAATDRSEAVGRLIQATLAMHRAGLQVAVQPPLAQEVVTHRLVESPATARHKRDQDPTTHTSPAGAAGLARTNFPGEATVPVLPVPASAARPVDPRVAFSRNR